MSTDPKADEGAMADLRAIVDVAARPNAGAWIRAVRRSRELSQRELSAIAGVPSSTVARVESGRNTPTLETFGRLLSAAGYAMVLADRRGNLLSVDREHDRLRDRSGRRFPAHLAWSGKPVYGEDDWWGFHRIAWYDGRNVPDNVFWNRYIPPGLRGDGTVSEREVGWCIWSDAT